MNSSGSEVAIVGAAVVVLVASCAWAFRVDGRANSWLWRGPLGDLARRVERRPRQLEDEALPIGSRVPDVIAGEVSGMPASVVVVVSSMCATCLDILRWAASEQAVPHASPVRILMKVERLMAQNVDPELTGEVRVDLSDVPVRTPTAMLLDGDARLVERVVGATPDDVVNMWLRALEIAERTGGVDR